ncbi:hypothetical protein FNH22_14670 [Fulvivirga sp. M361]|uniref:hypothetical protein n=1 Tax=Fulvivirga sp. M361 TaxID=2594266 RepID=UPI00117A3CBF|nr:hypothetical protein [Fulvivirga sp. M361]TRX58299.1 hypothetical protein FNH22_14670 [Fulvivirga sp. M361]
MKRITLIVVALITGVSFQSPAQHFIASFGIEHSWGVPVHTRTVIYDSYYDHDWVHTRRVVRHGRVFFDVVLQRGNSFIELHIGSEGHIYNTYYRDYYPLHDHVCSYSCGYHPTYYRSHYNGCHSHNHHGHNHVVYRRNVHNHHKTYIVRDHHNHKNYRRKPVHRRLEQSKRSRQHYPERRTTYQSSVRKREHVAPQRRSNIKRSDSQNSRSAPRQESSEDRARRSRVRSY